MPNLALVLAAFFAATPLTPSAARGRVSAPADGPRAAAPGLSSAQQEFDLGQFHYVRGEYRHAADAFARAAARLEPARKPEARYWAALSWLGAGEAVQARSAFEDVIASGSPRAALAQLGLAQCWELAGRADRALATLAGLIDGGVPNDAAPTALARYAALAGARGDLEGARHARERLVRDYPASMEAAAEHLAAAAPAEPRAAERRVSVQIGAFNDRARARALADAARRAGLESVVVFERRDGLTRLELVLIGPFTRLEDARRAATRAAQRLEVDTRIVSAP